MQYRKDKYGNELSVLGFGCMRFQQKMGRIDLEEAEQALDVEALVEEAVANIDRVMLEL